MYFWKGVRTSGQEFNLSYEEWVEVWEAAGLYDQMYQGGYKQYIMARFDYTAPVDINNVHITTFSELFSNIATARGGDWPEEIRKKMSIKASARVQPKWVKDKIKQTSATPESRLKRSIAQQKRRERERYDNTVQTNR